MRRCLSILLFLTCIAVASGCCPAWAQDFKFDDNVPNELIVGWRQPIPARLPLRAVPLPVGGVVPHTSPALIQTVGEILEKHGFRPKAVLSDGRAWLIESFLGLTTPELERKASQIGAEPIVDYVAANNYVHFAQSSTPPVDDPMYPTQANLSKIEVEGAWGVTTGSRSVVVAVVDTGVDVTHTDLAGSLWNNPCEELNGQDDSCLGASLGNGKVDDIYGWNFASDNNDLSDIGTHGTAIAGVIAAVRNNALGIAGIGELSLAIMKTTNGSLSDVANVIQGFDYARQNGFPIATASFGTVFNNALRQSMELAGQAGMIVVAAAGDDDKDLDIGSNNVYPASFDFDWVISVAATTQSDQLKNGSNHGTTVIEIAAPGVGIWTTYPGNGFQAKDGSSMAVPHVAGVVGLILTLRPNATVAEIRNCLAQGDPALGNETVWGVRLNARMAVEACRPQAGSNIERPTRPILLTD